MRPLKEITIPSFLIGGLLDGYRDNVTDMLMQGERSGEGDRGAVEPYVSE